MFDLKDITILHSIFKITLRRLWILSCVHFDGYQVRGMHLYVGSSVESFLLLYDPYGPARAFIAKLLRKSPYEGRT